LSDLREEVDRYPARKLPIPTRSGRRGLILLVAPVEILSELTEPAMIMEKKYELMKPHDRACILQDETVKEGTQATYLELVNRNVDLCVPQVQPGSTGSGDPTGIILGQMLMTKSIESEIDRAAALFLASCTHIFVVASIQVQVARLLKVDSTL
jgi:hypothetical protein